jgi:hypothetical protein
MMTTTLRVRFDGKVLVPEEAVDLPVGQTLTFRLEPTDTPEVVQDSIVQGEQTGLQRLAAKLASFPPADIPADYSEQIDHYLYGTPKRADP